MPTTARGLFVGRSDELMALQDEFAAARRGEPRLVWVDGEAGVGKTALVRRFIRDVGAAAVLWASGDEAELALEFGVVEQLRAGMPVRSRGPRTVRAGVDSLVVGADLLSGIGLLERRGPVVVVVDDLDLVDSASAHVLLFVLRRLRREALLVVVVARPATLGRLGAGWARLLADRDKVRRVRLGGLSGRDVGALAELSGSPLADAAGERLRAHTAGNPLYVSALLDELGADVLNDLGTSLPAPHSYAATVLARVARLTRAAQGLVAAAAVLGRRSPLRTLADTAALRDPVAALDEAEAAGLLVTGGQGGWLVDFVHPLVRAAVYDDLSPLRRRALHRAAADAVGEPSSFRHRVAATAGTDAELAARLVRAADNEQADGALAGAADYYELASRVEPDPTGADRCLYHAVELWLRAGRVATATSYAVQVAERPTSRHQRYITALLDTPRGRLDEAVAAIQEVAESVSPVGDPDLYARAAAALAYLRVILGDHESATLWATRARGAAAPGSMIDGLAVQALAWGCARAGRFDEAVAELGGLDPGHDKPEASEAELLSVRGVIRTWAGDVRSAVTDLRAVDRWVRSGAPVSDIGRVYAGLAEAEFRIGSWDSAATHIELALSLGADLDHGWVTPHTHAVAAHLYAARGQAEDARGQSDAARRAAASSPVAEGRAYASLAEAHRSWGVGDWPGVIDALQELPDHSRDHPNLALWRCRMAEACIGEGRSGEALALVEQLPTGPWGGTDEADRTRLRALALHGLGEHDAARAAFVDATAALADRPATFGGAVLALDYGRFLLASGHADDAVGPLRWAHEVLLGLGARGFREACEAALDACGAPTGAGPRTTLEALTPRERVVARLVAGGATNREVAAQLYLSTKGVEYHLGNIFRKLGITSRRQLRTVLSTGHRPRDRHRKSVERRGIPPRTRHSP
ncbi:MAG TPA: AAA family ATPase [Segeticoccus sp.]|nr:AAA family ATPase [Segeticoccus sp.]